MKGVLTKDLIESATERLDRIGKHDEADALRELWRLWVENRQSAADKIVRDRNRPDPDDDPEDDFDRGTMDQADAVLFGFASRAVEDAEKVIEPHMPGHEFYAVERLLYALCVLEMANYRRLRGWAAESSPEGT